MPLRFQDFWCSSTLEREYLRLFLFSVKRTLQFYSHLDSVREDTGEVLLPGKSHGRRSLVSCSPRGRQESGTTERLHFHLSFSYPGEGNGNPLQYSWPGESQGRGAWWAAVYGVAQSRTRLKRLSSSSREDTPILSFFSLTTLFLLSTSNSWSDGESLITLATIYHWIGPYSSKTINKLNPISFSCTICITDEEEGSELALSFLIQIRHSSWHCPSKGRQVTHLLRQVIRLFSDSNWICEANHSLPCSWLLRKS